MAVLSNLLMNDIWTASLMGQHAILQVKLSLINFLDYLFHHWPIIFFKNSRNEIALPLFSQLKQFY